MLSLASAVGLKVLNLGPCGRCFGGVDVLSLGPWTLRLSFVDGFELVGRGS